MSKLGHHGEGTEVNSVLKGEFVGPDTITPATRDFLNACKLPQNYEELEYHNDIRTRYLQTVHSWKMRKEVTSSYNEHIGHYKAAMQDRLLSWFFFQRSDIPSSYGYSPVRHQRCIDCMVPKKQQSFSVESQRTIGILDSEFNYCNGIIGRQAINNGLLLNCIADE